MDFRHLIFKFILLICWPNELNHLSEWCVVLSEHLLEETGPFPH